MYVSDPKAPSYQFFAWSCKTDGTHNSEGAAPDGESYFAMALLFASNRWGRWQRHLRLPRRSGQAADGDGSPACDFAPGKFGMHSVGPMMNPETAHDFVCARHFTADVHRSLVSSTGVLRVVVALGAQRRSRVLGASCRDEPGIFLEDDKSADRACSGIRKLRRHSRTRTCFCSRTSSVRRVENRKQLVGWTGRGGTRLRQSRN